MEVAKRVAAADVVISTALIPGRAAPVLVTEDMVKAMKPGSVIIDIAAGKGPNGGGNCPLSEADRTVVKHGVTIVGDTNLPALVAADASALYARNVAALARILVAEHGGQVPADRAALEALPGVGRKTANVVLNVAFGETTMAVDTHIFRLGNRTGLAPGKTTRVVEDGLVRKCPPDMLRDAHHWLILHGRYICKARAPECWRCPAIAQCNYRDKVLAPPAR
jgi:alanine dehydrogenase